MAGRKKARKKPDERQSLSSASPTELKMWQTLHEDVCKALMLSSSGDLEPEMTWQLVKRRYASLSDERRCSSTAPDTHELRNQLDELADTTSDLVHQLLRETIERFPSSAILTEAWSAYMRDFRSNEALRELNARQLTNEQLGIEDKR